MKVKLLLTGCCVLLLAATLGCASTNLAGRQQYRWQVHDMNRPLPPVVTPGDYPGQPPSDAIVLFDGSDLSRWTHKKGKVCKWQSKDGYFQAPGTKQVKDIQDLYTKKGFGDCQLHIEWATSPEAGKGGQHSGNSGVFLMNTYEVQVLNSYNTRTYADGQAAAIYGQYPPLVNASRAPGKWQSYDIIFRRPHFNDKGKLIKPAYITVFHNGVLVQDHVQIQGATVHGKRAEYSPHPERMPLMLQDHLNPVRYRNIWIRDLEEQEAP